MDIQFGFILLLELNLAAACTLQPLTYVHSGMGPVSAEFIQKLKQHSCASLLNRFFMSLGVFFLHPTAAYRLILTLGPDFQFDRHFVHNHKLLRERFLQIF